MELLTWIGRQKARAVAALVVIGIFTPPLGALLKPFVSEAVIGLLIIAFLRMDVGAFFAYLRRPYLVLAATIWTSLAVPALFALLTMWFGVHVKQPALYSGLILQAIASPMMAAPAFAALMGLDAALVLATLIFSTALVPLSAWAFVSFLPLDLSLSPIALGVRLLAVLAGSAAIGLLLRRFIGDECLAERKEAIDGVNIVILFVFVSAVMGEVGTAFLNHPILMIGLLILAFAVFALLLLVTYLVFLAFGRQRSMAVAMLASQRNMGLMLAGTGGVVPDLTWLYFAVAQFPIYLSPLLLQRLTKWIRRGDPE